MWSRMTEDEAQYLLSVDDLDEIEDHYDELLFEFKHFLLSGKTLPSLIDSRVKRLRKQEEAMTILGYQRVAAEVSDEWGQFEDHSFSALFSMYQNQLGSIKVGIQRANSIAEVVGWSEKLLKCTANFAKAWLNDASLDASGVLLSNTLDPMRLYEEIREAEKMGIRSITDLIKGAENEVLLQESKRLSLWLQKEWNERNI